MWDLYHGLTEEINDSERPVGRTEEMVRGRASAGGARPGGKWIRL